MTMGKIQMKHYKDFLENVEQTISLTIDNEMCSILATKWFDDFIEKESKKRNVTTKEISEGSFGQVGWDGTEHINVYSECLKNKMYRISESGPNTLMANKMAIVYIFSQWEHFRKKEQSEENYIIEWDVMGDIRLIRNSIIHNQGKAHKTNKYKINKWFIEGEKMYIRHKCLVQILKLIRNEEDIRITNV